MPGKQPRAKVRLRLDRGTALLKQLGVSSVMCAILDLSENGCLCRISLADVDDDTAAAWRKLINPGRILTLEVTEPPELRHLQFNEAEVRWVKASPESCLDFGVLLKNLDPEQMMTLTQAMMTLASTKLRKSNTLPAPSSLPPPAKGRDPEPVAAKAAPNANVDAFLNVSPEAPPERLSAQSAPGIANPASKAPPAPLPKTEKKAADKPGLQSTVKTSPAALTASGRWKLSSGMFTQQKGVADPARRSDPQELPRQDTSNLERQKRQVLAAPVFYQFRDERNQPPDQETYEGRTIDFNEGGFMIEGPLPLSINEDSVHAGKWVVVCIIQVGGHELAARCRVRTLQPSPNADYLRLWGLQIVDMSEEDRRILREIYIRAGLTVIVKRR